MKKSLLAIVLAAATLPLTFAAQNSTPASKGQPASTSKKATKKTKKSVKHHSTKKTSKAASTSTAPKN